MATEAVKLTTTKEGAVRFEVHARPRARKSAVTGIRLGALVVQLAAPPVEGAANLELLEMLAQMLGVPKRSLSIAVGASSRAKVVEVRGLAEDDIRLRLGAGPRR
jgi:uncharacterized protein (TIGR00251 family)